MLKETKDVFKDLERRDRVKHMELCDSLFEDDDLWINTKPMYWQGLLPGNFKYGINLH